MKPQRVIAGALLVTMMIGVKPALAENLTEGDLPVPGNITSYQNFASGSVALSQITRRSGGEIDTVWLLRAVPLRKIEIQALAGQLQLHETVLILAGGQRLRLNELSDTPIFVAGEMAVSEDISTESRVIGIEIHAESMQMNADILVVAYSDVAQPHLLVNP